MKNIKNFQDDLDAHLGWILKYVASLEEVKRMIALSEEPALDIVDKKTTRSSNQITPIEEKVFSQTEYPKTGTLNQKILFLIENQQRALCNEELVDLIRNEEGEERAMKAKSQISGSCITLIYDKQLVSRKYNGDNRKTYYLKPSWRIADGSDIQPRFQPKDDALATMPATWTTFETLMNRKIKKEP